jgi:DNA-binding transcriptional LysR family regulator
MLNIEDLVVFVRTVDLGNLSAAGRDLRMTPALVSSRLMRLENRLGVRLLNRTTRRANATPEGAEFYDYCLRIIREAEEAENALAGRRDLPKGVLKVSAPVGFGRRHVAPHVPRFLEKYPDIQFRLVLTDRFTDHIEEQVDLLIRNAELPDSSIISRRLAGNQRVLCASPEYLANHEDIREPADLQNHNCLLLRFPGSRQYQWSLKGLNGTVNLSVSGNMDTDDGEILTDWCLAGHGIALKSVWDVKHYLEDGKLTVVLPDQPPIAPDIHALYPHSRYLPPRVRVFIDFLVETYAHYPIPISQ